uniref:Uncharacterized protein n=1 Tax=Gasterosteus aculeatus aculeatus TaxID=481459 RepID=A0AAQ4QYS9_GASAC
MRKRVTFVEQLEKETLLKNASGLSYICMSSAESDQRSTEASQSLPIQQVREMYRSQHMKTILIPKSMMSAPFLQHSALTAGHRRCLCSIANIYSTAQMRQQMKQRYLNVLHKCVQPGQNPTCRRRFGIQQLRDDSTLTKGAETDVARAKPRAQRKSRSSSTAHSDVILPKIMN